MDRMGRNGLTRTEEGFMDHVYEKLVATNGTKEMPVILRTIRLTEYSRVDKDKYIIQIWTQGVAELVQKGFKVIFSNYDLDCGFRAWVGEGSNWCSPYIGSLKVYDNSPVTLLKNTGFQQHWHLEHKQHCSRSTQRAATMAEPQRNTTC